MFISEDVDTSDFSEPTCPLRDGNGVIKAKLSREIANFAVTSFKGTWTTKTTKKGNQVQQYTFAQACSLEMGTEDGTLELAIWENDYLEVFQ